MTDKDERRKQRNRLSAKKSYWSKKHERRQLEKTHEKEERRQIVLHGEVTKLRQYAQHLEYVIQTADHSQNCRAKEKALRVLVTRAAGPQQPECRQFSASASTVAGQNTVGAWEQTEYNRQSTNPDAHCLLTPSNSFTAASDLGFKGSFTPSAKSDLGALNAQPRSDFDEAEAGSWYTDFTSGKANVHFENQTGQSSSAKDNDVFLGLSGFLFDQDSPCPPAPFVKNSEVKNGSKRIGLNASTQKEISEGFQINGNTQGRFLALPKGTGQRESTAAVCTRSEARFQENTTMAGGSVGRRTPRSLENNAGRTCSVSSHKSVTVTHFPNVGAFPSQPTEKLSVQSTDEFLTPSDVFINTPCSFRTVCPPRPATFSRSREVSSVDPFTTMNTGRSITITELRTLPPGPEFSIHQADRGIFTHEKPSLKPDKTSAYWKTSTTTAQQTAQLESRIGWNQTSAKYAEIAQNSFSLTQEKRTSLIATEANTLPAVMPNGAPALSSSHTDYLPRFATLVRSGSTEVTSVNPSPSDFLPPSTLSEDSGCAIDHLLSNGKLSRLFEIVENMDSQDLHGSGLVSVEKETASCFKDTQLSCTESVRNLSNDPGSHYDSHLYQDIHHTPQTVRVGTAANITANTSSALVKASQPFQVPETLGTECGQKPSVTLQDINIRLKGNFTEEN